MGRVVSMKYPDGEVVSYTYNVQLLLESMGGYVTGTTYNALGKPTQITLGNGRVTDMQYCWLEWGGKKPFGAIAWIKTTKAGYPNLQDLQYTYDNMGNPTQIYDPRNGETNNYGYDDLDRLLSASAPIGGSYSYNQIANLLSKTEGGVTYNLDYTGTTHKHAPVSVNGVAYTYDANGNLTNRSGIDLKYDAENRLVKISQGSAYVARLAYDGDGKRTKRVDTYGSIHYVGPHYERNVGNGQDTTEVITKYYYGQLGPYRRPVAIKRNNVLYYVHSDHLGGTHILSDTSGAEVAALRYHSYGATRVQSGSVPTDKRFTGQILDQSSGLYHYGARYYDQSLARFIQPDSIVPQPGNPQALNRYSYVLNNPLTYTDPTGQAEVNIYGPKWLEWGGGGGAGGIGIIMLGILAMRALQVTGQQLAAEGPKLFEAALAYAKGLSPMRYEPALPPDIQKEVNAMMEDFAKGQPPGGWNLDPKTAGILGLIASIVLFEIYQLSMRGSSLSQRQGDPFDRGPEISTPLVTGEQPTWGAGEGSAWEATGVWRGWALQFYQQQGHLPTIQDVYDRHWSLELLQATGRAPSPEDWERHYYNPEYMGE